MPAVCRPLRATPPRRSAAAPRSAPRVAARALALAAGVVAAACAAPPAASDSRGDGSRAIAGRWTLVAAIDDRDRPRNAAWTMEADAAHAADAADAAAVLWEADAEISDWLPRPDGGAVLYREVWHYVPKTEALVVRALAPGAAPRYVVMGEPELRRLAGQAWSPDGTAIAYASQAGPAPAGVADRGAGRWELRRVEPGADDPPATDQRVFALDGPAVGGRSLVLLAWLPERDRVAVLEAPADGGPAAAVRVYDTASGRLVARRAPGGGDPLVAPAPDGRRVAWLDPAVGVGVVDVATGRWTAVAGPLDEAGAAGPLRLAWSADGRTLAWAVAGARDGASSAAASGAAGAGGSMAVRSRRFGPWPLGRDGRGVVPSGADAIGLLAVAPDGRWAVLTRRDDSGRPGAWVVPLAGGGAPAFVALPAEPWGMGWGDATAGRRGSRSGHRAAERDGVDRS